MPLFELKTFSLFLLINNLFNDAIDQFSLHSRHRHVDLEIVDRFDYKMSC